MEPPQAPSVWRFARASRACVVIDADDYFELVQEAMLRTRERIMLVGWDFDTRVRMTGGRRWWQGKRKTHYPARFGAFIAWLARRRDFRLRVFVLRWNFGALKFLVRGTMALDLLRWAFNPAIRYRLDAAHPFGASQHQKLVVLDDRLAACGGIDMTCERWDTSEHRDADPRRRYGLLRRLAPPWHDLAMLVEGEAAAALGEVARERWARSGGGALPPCAATTTTPWPPRLAAEFENIEIGIARTNAGWRDCPPLREVEALFLAHIARARRFIYIETQYFAGRRIAEAIAQRLIEPSPPEIILITAARAVTALQRLAMDSARQRLFAALAAVDHAGRFRTYVPMTAGGEPIYVHSKLMIVDDEILRVGSANCNNRSMGLDSECDIFIDTSRPGNGGAGRAIRRLRTRLIAEHVGANPGKIAAQLAAGATMADVIAAADQSGKHLAPFRTGKLARWRQAVADGGWLDPDRPAQVLASSATRLGLFAGARVLTAPPLGHEKDRP